MTLESGSTLMGRRCSSNRSTLIIGTRRNECKCVDRRRDRDRASSLRLSQLKPRVPRFKRAARGFGIGVPCTGQSAASTRSQAHFQLGQFSIQGGGILSPPIIALIRTIERQNWPGYRRLTSNQAFLVAGWAAPDWVDQRPGGQHRDEAENFVGAPRQSCFMR